VVVGVVLAVVSGRQLVLVATMPRGRYSERAKHKRPGMVKRLSKAETLKALDELPDVSILGAQAARALTPRQRKFAREVAQGKSKAQAYRNAYNPTPKPTTLSCEPYRLAADPRVSREIEALELAERAAAYRTPAKLREFVIQTLLEVALDPETKAAVRVQAVKTLGAVTEVAAFTHRVEQRNISTSEAARSRVLQEIKTLMASADDVTDVQAKSLLDELTQTQASPQGGIVATTPADTPGQYEDAQVLDSIRDDDQQQPEGMQKNRKNTQKLDEIEGGV
jgi:hypothetical protein